MFEVREIEAFLAVAAELHFGRAAERLRLSTARVSQTVRSLERRIGGQVFERTSRTVRLTPLGEQLLASLGPVYERLGQILDEARHSADHRTLMIGFSRSVPAAVQSAMIEAYETARPGGRVIAVPVNPMEVFRWDPRIGDRIDGFVSWLPPGSGRQLSPALSAGPVIRHSPAALLMSVDHPFAGRDVVDVEELADIRVLLPPGFERLTTPWVPSATPRGRAITTVPHDVRYLEGLPTVLAEGNLVHVTILDLGATLPLDGFVVVPLSGLGPFECRAIWATSRQTTGLLEFVRANDRR